MEAVQRGPTLLYCREGMTRTRTEEIHSLTQGQEGLEHKPALHSTPLKLKISRSTIEITGHCKSAQKIKDLSAWSEDTAKTWTMIPLMHPLKATATMDCTLWTEPA